MSLSGMKDNSDSYCKDGYLIVFNEDEYNKNRNHKIDIKESINEKGYLVPSRGKFKQYFKKYSGGKYPVIGVVVVGNNIDLYWLQGPATLKGKRYFMHPTKIDCKVDNIELKNMFDKFGKPLAVDNSYKLFKVKVCANCDEEFKTSDSITLEGISYEEKNNSKSIIMIFSSSICKWIKAQTKEEKIKDLLFKEKNLIFYGPPGTGKTYFARKYVFRSFYEVKEVVFHPSYSYEEFIGGIYPTARRGRLLYRYKKGIFFELCEKAKANPDKKYLLFIDEINRANLSAVFGEALNLIEKDKRGKEVELPYGMKLSVPENLHILGTMNTLDKSVAGIDYAMRRRFAFVRFSPNSGLFIDSDKKKAMEAINKVLGEMLGWDYLIGHAYFMEGQLEYILSYKVMPLIEEYFGGDHEMIKRFWKRVCNRVKGEDGNIVRDVFLELYGYDLKCGSKYNLSDKKL